MHRLSFPLLAFFMAAFSAGCLNWFDEDNSPADYSSETEQGRACEVRGSTFSPLVATQQDLENLRGCRYIDGDLVISQTEVTSLEPLEDLQSISGDFTLSDNPWLDSLDGLEKLVEVEGNFVLTRCFRTHDLAGLSSLVSVGLDFRVESNPALSSVLELEQLRFVDGTLVVISNNPLLPECQAEDLADHLVEYGFDGSIALNGNSPNGACDENGDALQANNINPEENSR